MDCGMTTMDMIAVFESHCATKAVAVSAVHALERGLGCEKLTPELLMSMSFSDLCTAKGVGRKTVLLAAEVACDLAGKKK